MTLLGFCGFVAGEIVIRKWLTPKPGLRRSPPPPRTELASLTAMELRAVLRASFKMRGYATSAQLQRALGISRQGVWKQVRPLVETGELEIDGAGRGVRYVPGKGAPIGGGVARGTEVGAPDWHSFWTTLIEQRPGLAYVSVRHAARGTHRREHGLALIADLRSPSHLVLDFEDVDRIGLRFAEAVLFDIRGGTHGRWVLAINASPAVRRALALARRNERLRPVSGYGE